MHKNNRPSEMMSLCVPFRRPAPAKQQPPLCAELNGLDIISRLPYELRGMILAQLDLVELSTALCVSHLWRDNWLGDESRFSLSNRYFPGLAEYIHSIHASSADDGQSLGEPEMFRRALHRIQRRARGKFASYLHHAMVLQPEAYFRLDRSLPVHEGGVHGLDDSDGIPASLMRYPRFMMYSNGRIAWWPESYGYSYLAVIDDLRTRVRRAYMFPRHGGVRQGYKTAMSSRLFVMGRGPLVNVWHLELNCLRSFWLSDEFERCIMEGERVLFVSKSADIYLWSFGGTEEPRRVDLERLDFYLNGRVVMGGLEDFSYRFSSHHIGLRFRDTGMLLDFIIHPVFDGVFFIITLGSNAPRQLMVHEVHDNEPAGSYLLEHPLISTPNIGDVGYLRWEKTDSYGSYCLAHIWLDDVAVDEARDMSGADTPLAGCSPACGMSGLISVCFNIYTKRFTLLHHPIARNRPSVQHLWNGQVITNNSHEDPGTPTHGLIRSVNCCSGPHQYDDNEQQSFVPLYTSTPGEDSSSLLQRRYKVDLENLPERTNVGFTLNPDQRFGSQRNRASEHGGVKRIMGDDDFLLFVDGSNYSSWSFGAEIPEQLADDRRTRWWKKFTGE